MYDSILEKYNENILSQLNKENMTKIILFLEKNNCEFIEDIINDYLDLLAINYNDFITKYNILNKKYNGLFLEKASENMNLLEEFYQI